MNKNSGSKFPNENPPIRKIGVYTFGNQGPQIPISSYEMLIVESPVNWKKDKKAEVLEGEIVSE